MRRGTLPHHVGGKPRWSGWNVQAGMRKRARESHDELWEETSQLEVLSRLVAEAEILVAYTPTTAYPKATSTVSQLTCGLQA
jgi:hypothetical protein